HREGRAGPRLALDPGPALAVEPRPRPGGVPRPKEVAGDQDRHTRTIGRRLVCAAFACLRARGKSVRGGSSKWFAGTIPALPPVVTNRNPTNTTLLRIAA